MTLLLVVDEKERQKRRDDRGSTDYFEELGTEFHNRVLEGYVTEARRLGIPIVDGNGTVDEVHEKIWSYVEPLLEKE